MTPGDAVHQISEAMLLVMVLSMPPIIVASVVGIVVSLLQALTQIQEQTLSFAIKLVAVAATIAAMAGFLGNEMLTYTLKLFNDFPKYTHVARPPVTAEPGATAPVAPAPAPAPAVPNAPPAAPR